MPSRPEVRSLPSSHFVLEDIAPEEIRRRRTTYEPLTHAVRELIDAAIRTEADEPTVAEALELVRTATNRLREKQIDGTFGVRFTSSGESMAWGNPVIGIRNPLAPPMVVERDDTGAVWSDVTLGAPYEGPTGMAHGGICALLLDHLLGEAASADGSPTLTGEITVRFVRATPLGLLHARAKTERRDEHKKFVTGTLSDADGVTVEANGVFIVPRWAR